MELITVSVLLMLIVPVGVLALLLAVHERGRRRYRSSFERVRSALIRLQYKPQDPAALRELLSSLESGDWLKSGQLLTDSELWRRSLDFGFGHIQSGAGQHVLHGIVKPMAASYLGNPADLLRRVHSFLDASRGDARVLTVVTGFVKSLRFPSQSAGPWLSELVSLAYSMLSNNPRNRQVQSIAMTFLAALKFPQQHSQWLYDRTLDLVGAAPQTQELAILSLEVRRWHCANSRPDGKVTLYDEQMVQNDIAVRTGQRLT